MTTHLLKMGTPLNAMRTRCGHLLGVENTKLTPEDYIGSEDSIEAVDCPQCLQNLIIEMRLKEMGAFSVVEGDREPTPEDEWIAGGDTGTSSITIWHVMTGRPMPNRRHPDHPHDPADFGRCHRLLEKFPEWRPKLGNVAEKYPEWRGLVDHWYELTALYLKELAENELPQGKRKRASRLYERMRELFE